MGTRSFAPCPAATCARRIIWGVLVGWQPRLCRALLAPCCVPQGGAAALTVRLGAHPAAGSLVPRGASRHGSVPASHTAITSWPWVGRWSELAGRSTGSQVDSRQNNSGWIVLQAEVLLQILGPRGSQQKPGHQTALLNTASRSQTFSLRGYLHQCPATCAKEIKGSILPHCATLLPPALPCCSAFFCKAFL